MGCFCNSTCEVILIEQIGKGANNVGRKGDNDIKMGEENDEPGEDG